MVLTVMRLARKKVLVRNMKCIETLARVDVLCVDKTGTITENTMKVSRLVPAEGKDLDCITALLSNMVSAMSSDNITMEAMKEFFTKTTKADPEKVFSFSSQYKYSGCILGGQNYVLGAPEFVLREQFDNYAEEVYEYSEEGYRVLAFVKYLGEMRGTDM